MTMRQVNPAIAAKIDAIDLTNAKKRLMDPKLGKGWSKEQVEDLEVRYKNFLKMISTGMTCVPTKFVDEMWHVHILDTETYAKDCQRCFGYFVHHRPYMADTDLKKSWEDTKSAHKDLFGTAYSKETT